MERDTSLPFPTASCLYFGEAESLKGEIDARAADTFRALPGRPQLEVNGCFKITNEENKEFTRIVKNQDVRNVLEIQSWDRKAKQSPQFFVIRQERSWTTLNISRKLFDDLLQHYNVFSHFWKAVLTFGRKCQENEVSFPGFRARRSFYAESDIFESAYVLRRVERHHRAIRADESPWSIRQTAIYHKLSVQPDSKQTTSTFILIAPSQRLQSHLSQSLESSKIDERAIGSWNIHRLLVVDSLRGWMEYMAWLEDRLREQSNLIVTARVGVEKDKLSPLIDFNINFVDRQTLKRLEDSVIDLQVILPILLGNITGVRDICQRNCEEHHLSNGRPNCNCVEILAEFDEHAREVECCIKKMEALKEMSKSTAQLLSDLLAYEDAISLKDVAQESRKESQSMLFLTFQSARDSVAVKVLTIISLIYLPSTMVANFFSTQFVQSNDNGDMAISGKTWLLAAISIPLTILTIAIWMLWVRFENWRNPPAPELATVANLVRLNHRNSFRSTPSSWRGPRPAKRLSDLESGMVSHQSTWASDTTVKSG